MTQHPVALAIALAFATSFTLPGCSGNANLTEQEHIQRAKDFEDKGNLRGSIVELKNAIQKNPDSPQARLLLGEVYLKAGLGAEAEKELRRAETLGVSRESVQMKLGEALLMMGEYQRVLDEVHPGSQTSRANIARIYQIRADALLRAGKIREGCDLYQQSLDVDKGNPPTYWGLARCAAAERDMAKARRWLDEALKLETHQAKTWELIGSWERLNQNPQAALAAYGNALKSDPHHIEALQSRAALHMALGNLDAAKRDVDLVAHLSPKSLAALYLQALLDFERKQFTASREGLQELFKIARDYPPSILLAGATDYALGSYEQAESHLTRYVARFPGHAYGRRLLAATLVQQKSADRALETLAPLITPGTGDVQALVLAGEAYRIKRDHARAAEYLGKAVAIDPKNASVQTQLGFIHLAAGDRELGLTELERAASLDPEANRADILLVTALLNQKQYDKALAAISPLERKLGRNPIIHVLRGNALLGKNDVLAARKSFEQALAVDPGHFPAAASLARLDIREKKPEVAETRFKNVLENDRNNLPAMMALAELAAMRNNDRDHVNWLEKAAKAHPRAIPPRAGLVQHLLAKNEAQKALAVANETVNLNPENASAHELLGSVLLAMNDVNGAITAYTKMARLDSQSADAYARLAGVQVRGNKLGDARTSLGTALKLQPDHEASLDTLIRLDMRDGKPDQALRTARRLQTSRPQSPLGYEREGDILMYQKNPSSASKAYDQALATSANSALFIKSHSAHVMARSPTAEQQLKNWLSKYPKDTVVRFYSAEYYASTGRQRDAIAAYEALLSHSPRHSIALNNLASLYQATGDKRALPTAEQAFKINPDNFAVLDTLGWILVEQGQVARGLDLIQKALTEMPGNPTIRYHRAVALAHKGDSARARMELESLLKDAPTFPQAEAARAQLGRL